MVSTDANGSSRQIRPPIYSLKQTKLRKRRVVRYAILYFVLFVVFVALIAGPAVAGRFMKMSASTIPMNLLQPTGLNHNDTSNQITGSRINNAGGDAPVATGSGAAAAPSGGARFRAV